MKRWLKMLGVAAAAGALQALVTGIESGVVSVAGMVAGAIAGVVLYVRQPPTD